MTVSENATTLSVNAIVRSAKRLSTKELIHLTQELFQLCFRRQSSDLSKDDVAQFQQMNVILDMEDRQKNIEPFAGLTLLETLAILEPLEEEFPDVDEGLLPLDDIDLETEIQFDQVDRSSAIDNLNRTLPVSDIKKFCQQWRISELAFFGSMLRSDFSSDSDIDVMVSFHPSARWGLFDHAQMQQALAEILGRSVDLVTKRAVEQSGNRLIRERILNGAKILFSTTSASTDHQKP